MRALIQRVSRAAVYIEDKKTAAIGKGQLVLLGVQKGDSEAQAEALAAKVCKLRIFEDMAGKMNLAVGEINGSLLVVSQFTLAGDTSRGNRPGFETAENPERANHLYQYFVKCCAAYGIPTATGVFQADMQVELVNDGPVTFLLEK